MLGVGFNFLFEQDIQRVFNIFGLSAPCASEHCGCFAKLPCGAIAGLGIFAEGRLFIVLHAFKIIIGLVIFLRMRSAVIPELPLSIAALGCSVLGGFVTAGPFARFYGRSGLFLGGGFWLNADFVEEF